MITMNYEKLWRFLGEANVQQSTSLGWYADDDYEEKLFCISIRWINITVLKITLDIGFDVPIELFGSKGVEDWTISLCV